MTDIAIGPEHGSLTLHTGVEGRAAKMGHALTVRIADWSGLLTVDGSEPSALTLRAVLKSMEVVSGEGGVKPLSDKDKRTITSSALETLSADKHPEVIFTSRSIAPSGDGYDLTGDLAIAGTSQSCVVPLKVQRTAGSAKVKAEVPVVQSAHGVQPYTGLMGGLKVKDQVHVRLEAEFPVP